MPTKGAMARSAAIAAVATSMVRVASGVIVAAGAIPVAGLALMMLALLPEETRGLDQQHDHHDDENHRSRRLGVEDLRQPFDHAQAEPRDDRAENRAHPADHHDGEYHDDHVG